MLTAGYCHATAFCDAAPQLVSKPNPLRQSPQLAFIRGVFCRLSAGRTPLPPAADSGRGPQAKRSGRDVRSTGSGSGAAYRKKIKIFKLSKYFVVFQ